MMKTIQKQSIDATVLPQISLIQKTDESDLGKVISILSKWKCSDQIKSSLLGFETKAAFQEILANPEVCEVSNEQKLRILQIIKIDQALNILLVKASADTWVNRPNTAPLFNGKSAIEIMQSGQIRDLTNVAEYLYGNILI